MWHWKYEGTEYCRWIIIEAVDHSFKVVNHHVLANAKSKLKNKATFELGESLRASPFE